MQPGDGRRPAQQDSSSGQARQSGNRIMVAQKDVQTKYQFLLEEWHRLGGGPNTFDFYPVAVFDDRDTASSAP